MRVLVAMVLAAGCSGCASNETVRFQASAQQQALVRDGQAALVSRAKNSIVLIRPATRQFSSRGRPVFGVGIYNLSNGPLEFRVSSIHTTQMVDEQAVALSVVPYEQLVGEERNRRAVNALVVGLAGNR